VYTPRPPCRDVRARRGSLPPAARRSFPWCFRHELRDPDEPGAWLAGRYADWAASGLSWDIYFRDWLRHHGLHPASVIRRELDARFTVSHLSTGPYYFPELLDADTAAEQAAIDAGQLRAGSLRYAGRPVRPTT
jgi:hypothetical protein